MSTVVVTSKNPEDQTLVKVERRTKPAPIQDAEVVEDLTPEEASREYLFRHNEIGRLHGAGREAVFAMGVHLREIQSKKLFHHGAYKNFEEYVTALNSTYGLTYKVVLKLIKIVENFTQEEFKTIGHTKCRLILEALPEQREGLKNQAKNGVGRRDIEPQVRAGHQGNSIQQVDPVEPEDPEENEEPVVRPAGPTKEVKQSEKRVTCVAREGLYGHALIDRKTELPATIESLKSEPAFTNITFENGATGLFIVQVDPKTGQLKAKICFQRKE